MAEVQKLTIQDLAAMKKEGKKISMITAYSYPQALVVDEAGIDIILVGDSLGMVELGYAGTTPVTMDEMLSHTKPVMRAVKRAHVVGDLPFMSYNISVEQAITNAGILYKDGGCDSVKLEGGQDFAKTVGAIVKAGIPVFGHIGLTPQTAGSLGGFKVQGKSLDAAKKVLDDAIALDEQGVFAVILEAIPRQLAEIITKKVKCVTVGIGGGVNCDGQVLVFHDLLGLFKRFTPKFVKVYANAYDFQLKAIQDYIGEVQQSKFPDDEHSFTMKPEVVDELKKYAGL
ncbi:MAG: 3-methyl-2-oxobutanoate hydroxymethyltransferase [Spirochaetia bacterium]|jgi:3-methyl-2-oxobutanoate hydroxymethyltransferase|uniref:3-methyl-2-oxobutanoate hydroxymethyltransferase n=1 Tax=bioreactor metagenome TaxID=1076179 RepID=A0A644V2Y9_9ZZZZ|nr:3-methyl-2-oxobutanoate hydroxymethyltransferase [Spirochaetia bacterium]MDD3821086.1 3-methyl-2-oxobutanoate hydroxymethyltransferase [Spirochaetales bacterium]NLX45024.1 3-methyl-2-oxobutanoate hydroxymethyltransferase [Treponema sp.]VBB41256.1 3-methyl-2-oxobutanoate hydroxymethyltransferase [uncultured Spirochaetota bacterium]HAP54767.1 3-methyl-2-oxobutanoate hydroxymethyltransferase [Spirochaetaceae bacterium]